MHLSTVNQSRDCDVTVNQSRRENCSPFVRLLSMNFFLLYPLSGASYAIGLPTQRIDDARVTQAKEFLRVCAAPRRRKSAVHFLGLPAFPAANGRIIERAIKTNGGGRRKRGTEDRCVDRSQGESNVWTEGAQQCAHVPLTSWRSV